ncbi:AI-2E family transporter [Nonomuraea soli]|uniref:Putative PurR-regulated permease PerM n=1 Tax=Nonomuraea soli TaxID=1032476 RepID=A0A7W0CJ99_9ACTN|nr:AI-2E family transporter [Nonomuraea soli]MBA2891965.1 putative PurR-regulated permease PerM [Nonomuraea soli]
MLSRGLRILVGLAAALIVLAGVQALSDIVGPAFLALTLVIAVGPLMTRLSRRGAPTWVVVAVPLAVVLLVLAALGLAVVVSVARFTALIPQYAAQFQHLLTEVQAYLATFGITQAQATKLFSGIEPGELVQAAAGLLSGLLGTASATVVIVLLLYGMCMDAPFLTEQLRGLASSRRDIVEALTTFTRQTCKYLLVSTLFGLIVAVLDAGALWILGVPLPLLWGLLAFITNFIPNIGFIIGLVPPALLALLDSGVGTMLWVIVVYCVLNFIIQSVIQPKFVGESAGLSVTITILSLLVWTWALGALGAILAVPLSSFVRAILLDSDPATRWATPLVAGKSSD